MIAFGWIEWNWGEAILDESWRDVVTIAGFGLTFVGFAITLIQIRKTQSAAKAAKLAAEETLAESRLAYHKFTIALPTGYLRRPRYTWTMR